MHSAIEQLKAAGLDPIVLDEDTDFGEVLGNRLRKYESNTEFVSRVMEFGCPTGALIQAFVIEALTRYADDVLDTDEYWENGLIDSVVWKRTAEFLKSELDKKYKA
jgi:hypothetical protein